LFGAGGLFLALLMLIACKSTNCTRRRLVMRHAARP
jgi:hypothetical protein